MVTAPGASVCLRWCAWHWLNRFPDVFCILQSVTQMLFWGHAVVPSMLLNNPLVSRRGKCVFVCVCVYFWRAPWGEAGQLLPAAVLGQGMAIQDTCLASGPNFIVALFVFSPAVHTLPSLAIYTDPHFNPSVLTSPFSCFVCIPIVATCFPNCVCVSLSHSQFMSHAFPLYLSILARLYFFISCAVGGGWRWGSPTGRQSTLILIRRRIEQSGGWELWAVNGTGQLSEPTTTLLVHVCLQA